MNLLLIKLITQKGCNHIKIKVRSWFNCQRQNGRDSEENPTNAYSLEKKMTHKKGKGKYLFFSGSEENYVRNGARVVKESIALFHGKANPIRHISVDDLNNMNVERFPRVVRRFYEFYNGFWEGSVVLVKKFHYNSSHDVAEFCLREIVVATQMATHNNAHKILGCCLETDLPVLVYERMPPETLEERIFVDDENKSKAVLEWKDRLRIAWEISHVVAYFHNAFPRPIIHSDLTPSNVFLDQDNATKLGDFSLSISIPEDKEFILKRITGTNGYLAPEYIYHGKVAKDTDVYSFGILFLVLLTGKRPYPFYIKEYGMLTWVKSGIKNNCFHEIVDPTIIGNGMTSIEDLRLRAFAQLALRCVFDEEDCRPTMVEVATELKNMIRSLEGGGIYRYFIGSKENFIQNKALVLEESIFLFHGKVDPIRYFSADELNNMNVELWHNNCNWYKGSWEGKAVLVKLRESVPQRILLRLFREIVIATQMSTHNNVHKLLGCCLETKVPVLIYEWVAAETLEDRLLLKDEKQNKLPVLEWKDRLRIAWEISYVLSYFHSAFPRPFIHGYLEPRNVFLNQDNTAILSNFGLFVSIPKGQNFVVDHFEKETRDYEAFECQIHRNFTEDTDVYSFGVLFLMLLTGKDATFSCICIGENAKSTYIIDWVTEKIRNKRISEIVDPVINNSEVPASELSASIDLALRCTSFEAYKRPTMEDVEIELCTMLRSSKSIPTTSSDV